MAATSDVVYELNRALAFADGKVQSGDRETAHDFIHLIQLMLGRVENDDDLVSQLQEANRKFGVPS